MRIKALRKEKGYAQNVVASKIGIKQSSYCNIENGRKNPSIKTAKRLAELFGVTVDELLRDGGEEGGEDNADDGEK